MIESDVLKLLILLEAEYPNSFSKLNDQQKALKKELWVTMTICWCIRRLGF